jgi:spore germination protein GerM
MILVSLHTKSSSMFHAVCLQIVLTKMENPDNEDIIVQIEETLRPSVPLTK